MSNSDTNQIARTPTLRDELVDYRYYLRVVVKFWWGILGLGLIFGVLTTVIVVRQDDVYESTASLLIASNQAQITSIEQLYGIDTQQREYYATQHEMLKNRILAESVISELDLLNHPEFSLDEINSTGMMSAITGFLTGITSISRTEPSSALAIGDNDDALLAAVYEEFSRRLSVEPVSNTQLVRITFEANDPQLSADLSNSLANSYIKNNLEQRLDAAQTANSWLNDRLVALRETLEESELRLQQFLEQEQLINSVGGVTSLNARELDELTSQSVQARRLRAEAEAVYRQIQSIEGGNIEELMNMPAILNHPSVQILRNEADRIDREIAELSIRYGRKHPRMISLASQRAAAETNLSRQVRQVYSSIENGYLAELENERSTIARLDQSKSDLQYINRNNFTLHELEREVETNRQLYDMFFTRVRETDQTDSFENTNAIVVDPAIPALLPSKPRRQVSVVLAIMAGLFAGMILAFVRDLLDNTIKTPSEVGTVLDAEVLGVVPLVDSVKPDKTDERVFVSSKDPTHSGFDESLRTIRTGITLSSLDNPHKTIALTSSITNEGKSTVTLNLAVTMGQLGKTLLIDADMRRPSIAKSIGLRPNSPGLSNLIVDGVETKDDCIQYWLEGGISILPAGHFVSNPLEMISSQKFKQVLAHLQLSYDYIIVDTPPVNAVSDALIIGSIVDAVAYVVKADSTSINNTKIGLSRIRNAHANFIGVILNQINTKKQYLYGEGELYGGYYDSYGYSGTSGSNS